MPQYNLDLAAIQQTQRLDANESVFFARQLEYIRTKLYNVKKINLSALNLMPLDTSVPEGAETLTWRAYDTVGSAKIIASYGNDLPRADVIGSENTTKIKSLANAFGYTVMELRAAAMAGVNLTQAKMNAAARAHQEFINRLAFNGDTEHGLPGFLTNPNIPSVVLPADGTGSTTTWSTKTAAQIVRDVNLLINTVRTQSAGFYEANEVWLPIAQQALIASTQNSTASDTTVLGFLRNNFPDVTFRSVFEMAGAGAGGTNRMYAMDNSLENWQLVVPMMMRTYAPQMVGLEYQVPMESRFGGVIVTYPLAFAYADGI